ncbi:YkvA family protein [Thermaurantiacus sp.]
MTEAGSLARLSHRLKRDAHMLWLAARDPRTPGLAKLLGGLVAAYVLSPLDLLPEFIPVIGLLDDLLIVTVGLSLVLWLMPPALVSELRTAADKAVERPVSRAGLWLIGGLWAFILLGLCLQLLGLRYW